MRWQWLSCLFLPLCSVLLGSDSAVDYLKQYAGRWVGDFTIHSAATNYTQTFAVEQHYWWEDDCLRGVSVSDTDDGLQSARSTAFVDNERYVLEVVRGDTEETYFGVLHDGGIVWLSSDLGRATDYQMREAFVEVDGATQLHTDGFDSYVYEDGLAHLVYRGRLKRVSEEGAPEE